MSAGTRLTNNSRQLPWRKVWLNFHLYLGLSAGLIFVLAGLTGSLLVFYVELDEIINPELQISAAQAQQQPQSYEAIFQAIQKAHPERSAAWRLEIPRHPQAMMMARYYTPVEKAGLSFAPLIAWINPYTSEVVSSRFWGEFVMTWLFDLHYALLLDETGKTLMGIIGFILLIPVISGIYLWWPASGKWWQAFLIKRHASKPRFIFDLHKTNGVYSFMVLLLLLISGAVLDLHTVFTPVINYLSPMYHAEASHSNYQVGVSRITLDQAAALAKARYPEARLRWIETPDGQNGTYRIVLYQQGEPSLRFPKTTVWIDQYSGTVLSIRDPREEHAGDTFMNWLHPLHNGEIAGMTGRIVVFISGFVPAILYVTGLIRWLQKRRAKSLHQLKIS
ncbi:MAG: PepSY-associated TM helix domain-containing protein [Methylococcaceae bacterium]|nr:PepSY-associated TM helix domain-containing protein [Methylococcaceae bacterium]MDP3903544.1 PepSY-associated TM helix domain-containing protein [Methylococcaceae bacterium]